MSVVEVNGRELEADEQGYLQHWEDWSEEIAEAMAAEEGIELGEGHWEVIHFLRDYYAKYEVAPPIRILVKNIAKRLGKDKGNTRYLYQLFPYGPAKQACRFAGLPKPTGCI